MTTAENELNNLAILKMIRIANSLVKEGDRFFKQYGVTTSQYNVLVILNYSKTKINQSDLGTQLVVSRSDITGIVDRLEKLGYAKREDSPEDRRVKFISITERGKSLIKKVENNYFTNLKNIVRFLTNKDKENLTDITDKLEKAIG